MGTAAVGLQWVLRLRLLLVLWLRLLWLRLLLVGERDSVT